MNVQLKNSYLNIHIQWILKALFSEGKGSSLFYIVRCIHPYFLLKDAPFVFSVELRGLRITVLYILGTLIQRFSYLGLLMSEFVFKDVRTGSSLGRKENMELLLINRLQCGSHKFS